MTQEDRDALVQVRLLRQLKRGGRTLAAGEVLEIRRAEADAHPDLYQVDSAEQEQAS